jgi:tRNA(fMet)-specific endonuclease VapC
MPAYLLDTNHVGLAVDRTSVVGQRLFEARLGGIRIGTCLPVLCELEAGMRQVRNKVKYRRDLNHLLRQVRLWPMDLKTARLFGNIYHDLRRRGRVLSQVDIMVAALARQIKLVILTTDRDFEVVPAVRTEDWSKP